MAVFVTTGATLQCSFGAAPAVLSVLPMNREMAGTPGANIMDHAPFVNIPPFGTCNSMSNPMVAAATAAALGAFTPMPCIPVTSAPWIPGSPTVMVANMPAVQNSCKLMCNWGGVIQVIAPSQFQTMVA
ncbi:MAG TPA: DUF4280 domain-containing protein [Ramlibacter sp.]|uniref:DUF4280 domain-containing protein n=1 Tax=Ramlibacter sp. TaxID=1917967 RepID=UPI002CCD5CEC|nr:DUF4280 domain-containing protein [Ramlibacter sp.]HVZ43834.1 DUF4280 domain-containing protein [Ramlibacter sp.]